ncbi:hypothetical protein [Halanaerobaculum tunisiense]
MLLVGLIVAFFIVVLVDLPGLIKKEKRGRVMFLYFFLLFLGFMISFLQMIDKAPTNPTIITRKIVRLILGG